MAHRMYKTFIKDIIDQAHAVHTRARDLAGAEDTEQLNSHLAALEHSMDILKICVSGVRHTVGSHLPKLTVRPKTWSKYERR